MMGWDRSCDTVPLAQSKWFQMFFYDILEIFKIFIVESWLNKASSYLFRGLNPRPLRPEMATEQGSANLTLRIQPQK